MADEDRDGLSGFDRRVIEIELDPCECKHLPRTDRILRSIKTSGSRSKLDPVVIEVVPRGRIRLGRSNLRVREVVTSSLGQKSLDLLPLWLCEYKHMSLTLA